MAISGGAANTATTTREETVQRITFAKLCTRVCDRGFLNLSHYSFKCNRSVRIKVFPEKDNFQIILETEIIMSVIVLFKRYKHNLNVTVYYIFTRALLHYQSNKRYKTKVIHRIK